ncbi:thermonuclease family protein [Rhizobium sp. P44RR-XXIV]|uniref:thermonuclease family protein n=1 Tax=Rhizobium sp. P44RR-XXIV TaxID=1921145 RepID=UPI000987551B|nr:thermonuclease family protein [Rhizobium sp. P44RR-XXIV]TIX88877.1 thermonuclease family protein [Rhizobium sp. P44RR-XXIV]
MMRSSRLFRDGAVTFALLAILAFLALKLNNRPELVQTGRFYAIDGDTLSAHGERLRLKGIDAPEYRQRCRRDGADWACGEEARKALVTIIKIGAPECRGRDRDRYGRLLVTCVVGDLDINAAMVRNGMALSYGGYAAEERMARQAKAGVWAGDFERPSDYRREERLEHSAGGDPMTGLIEYLRGIVGWSAQ